MIGQFHKGWVFAYMHETTKKFMTLVSNLFISITSVNDRLLIYNAYIRPHLITAPLFEDHVHGLIQIK